jgi:hypothetical protein
VDSGLFIGWIVEMMLVCFALSVVLHAALGRVLLWSVLATALVPPILATAVDFGLPPYPSDVGLLGVYMAAFGSLAGLICASVGAWLAVRLRRFLMGFAAALRE